MQRSRPARIASLGCPGPGVPADLVNKIFVPFFTTREGGSGVGLALARQVMIAHGGFIRLVEPVGQGATFTLTF
ncbi:MAG: ATP-binding protein [Pseudomonadota bacterium]